MFKRKIKVPVPKVHVSSTTRHFSVRQLLVFALIFAALGGYLIWHSFAVTPIVGSVQAEAMTLPTGADIVSDSSASGGQAVRFSQDGTATSALSLSSQATSLAVTLKGMKCRGDVPHYTLSISTTGATPSNIFTVNGSAGSSGWSNVTTNKTIDAGNYNLSFTVSNSLSANNCNRDLYLDVVTFYGPAPATTALSFSGSPTTVSAGGSALLNWSATNATSCTASGAWSGDKPTSGSNVSTGALNATSTYKLTCAGADGTSTSQSVTISVALSTTSKSIYWGAIMDGDQTYAFYYGNPAPNGQNWADEPWGNTGNTWDRFEQNAGKKISVCHYSQPNPWTQTTFYNSTADICTNRGALVAMDMATGTVPLRDITAGKYDSSILTWAKNVRAWGRPMFLRFDTEMNGDWEGYGPSTASHYNNGNTPQDFIDMWRHFHDVAVNQGGATNISWWWVPNVGTTDGSDILALNKFYPGDAYVDWTGFDGYNQASTSQSFTTIYKPSYDMELQMAPSKPMGIGEVSSYEYGGQKASWITSMLTTELPNNFPNIKMVQWFNWRNYQNGFWHDWPIESSASATAAFKSAIASPYYAPNNSNVGSLPLGSKVPIPQ
jgi:hypothetical protein